MLHEQDSPRGATTRTWHRRWIAAAAVSLGALVVAVGSAAGIDAKEQPKAPAPLLDHLEIALRADPPGSGRFSADWRERFDAAAEIRASRDAVRRAVLDVLRKGGHRDRGPIVYGSRLHVAITLAGSWGVRNAEPVLVALAGVPLDGDSIPDGGDVGGAAPFPAAQALVRLRVPAPTLMRHARPDDVRVVAFVLATVHGRDAALGYLAGCRPSASTLTARVRELVSATEQVHDLLPPPSWSERTK